MWQWWIGRWTVMAQEKMFYDCIKVTNRSLAPLGMRQKIAPGHFLLSIAAHYQLFTFTHRNFTFISYYCLWATPSSKKFTFFLPMSSLNLLCGLEHNNIGKHFTLNTLFWTYLTLHSSQNVCETALAELVMLSQVDCHWVGEMRAHVQKWHLTHKQ